MKPIQSIACLLSLSLSFGLGACGPDPANEEAGACVDLEPYSVDALGTLEIEGEREVLLRAAVGGRLVVEYESAADVVFQSRHCGVVEGYSLGDGLQMDVVEGTTVRVVGAGLLRARIVPVTRCSLLPYLTPSGCGQSIDPSCRDEDGSILAQSSLWLGRRELPLPGAEGRRALRFSAPRSAFDAEDGVFGDLAAVVVSGSSEFALFTAKSCSIETADQFIAWGAADSGLVTVLRAGTDGQRMIVAGESDEPFDVRLVPVARLPQGAVCDADAAAEGVCDDGLVCGASGVCESLCDTAVEIAELPSVSGTTSSHEVPSRSWHSLRARIRGAMRYAPSAAQALDIEVTGGCGVRLAATCPATPSPGLESTRVTLAAGEELFLEVTGASLEEFFPVQSHGPECRITLRVE